MFRNVTCKTIPVQRSRGHSAVAGAAYRAGENITARGIGPEGEDKTYRYKPKAVVVRETFIMTPEGAPDWTQDRAELWNHVEAMETHKNARLGRDLNLGLAYELSHSEQRDLVMEFAKREFVDKGFIVDVAFHNYGRTLPAIGGSEAHKQKIREWAEAGLPFLSREEAQGREDVHVMEMRNRDGAVTGYKLYQPHAHLRATPRPWLDNGFATNKAASREMNKHSKSMEWRYEWPKLQNAYLETIGSDVRVRCTSDDEDQFPDIRFLGRSAKGESYSIDKRADELKEAERSAHTDAREAEQADAAFREAHNDSIKETFVELEETEGSTSESGQKQRVARWWSLTSERLHEWREDFREKAAEWRERIDHHRARIGRVFGVSEHDPPREDRDREERDR